MISFFGDDSNISHTNSSAIAGASNPNVTGIDGVSSLQRMGTSGAEDREPVM
ncbi:MAG: hypothetical protein IPI42_16510 [Saprospiraceae bacterium]|nr:hypothetical protein [Candidatus Parvibacillus calidus]